MLIFVMSKTDDKVNECSKMRFVTILCVFLVQIFPSRADFEQKWNTSLDVNFTDYEEELSFNDYKEDVKKHQALSSRANEENGYSLFEEHTLAKNTILKTFPVFDKEWSISFEVNPSHFEPGEKSILYLGYPYRHNNRNFLGLVLQINVQCYSSTECSIKPKQLSYAYKSDNQWEFFRDEEYIPKIGEWTQIKVSQQFDGQDYKIHFNNGAQSEIVSNPRARANVRVYASNPWIDAQPGQIRKLYIINGHIG